MFTNSITDELEELERIRNAERREVKDSERRMHEINRVWHFQHEPLVSLEEAEGTRQADEEIARWRAEMDRL